LGKESYKGLEEAMEKMKILKMLKLDVSNNELQDEGVTSLMGGLKSLGNLTSLELHL